MLTPQQRRAVVERLHRGSEFEKRSERGNSSFSIGSGSSEKTKRKWVWCTKTLDSLCWAETRKSWRPSALRTDTIQDVLPDSEDSSSFTVVTPKKSLHLQAASVSDRDEWIRCLKAIPTIVSPATSTPFNVRHVTHVDRNLEWSGDMSELIILEDLLGEGSFGQVYRGCHRDSGASMAVKLLVAEDITAIAHEIDILKQCSHANIVSYFGCWGPDSEGRIWIMMDFCNAGDTGALLELSKSRLPETLIRYICVCAVRALVFLHAKRIMHRDIKSGNILLTTSGDVKLADFGVSKQIQATIRQGGGGVAEIAGSPLWMAPEVIKGRPASYNSDVWSLGITAIELAEGSPPRSQLTSYQVMKAIARDDPPRLTSSKWSKDFREFVAMCLVKDPEQRPCATDLAQHKFISGANEPKLKQELYRYLKRHRKSNREMSSFGSRFTVLAQKALNKSGIINASTESPSSPQAEAAGMLVPSVAAPDSVYAEPGSNYDTFIHNDATESPVQWTDGQGYTPIPTPPDRAAAEELAAPCQKTVSVQPGNPPVESDYSLVALAIAGATVAMATWLFLR